MVSAVCFFFNIFFMFTVFSFYSIFSITTCLTVPDTHFYWLMYRSPPLSCDFLNHLFCEMGKSALLVQINHKIEVNRVRTEWTENIKEKSRYQDTSSTSNLEILNSSVFKWKRILNMKWTLEYRQLYKSVIFIVLSVELL